MPFRKDQDAVNPDLPMPHGLYDPRFEHDACGVSFVANVKGHRSRSIVDLGLTALMNMEHRGATGAEPDTGDGAGRSGFMASFVLRGSVRARTGHSLGSPGRRWPEGRQANGVPRARQSVSSAL
ncbi:MAG: hypothetical protein ACKOQ7_10630 [Actinomycetota bacterium]